MNRCGKCGKFTYFNSHFSREVCPYCGWIESPKKEIKYRISGIGKEANQKFLLARR